MKLAVLACVLAGCEAAAAPTPVPVPKQFEHDMIVRFHMHENFDVLRAMEKLLVRGNLEAGRVLANAIALAPDEPGLDAFAKRAAAVRERAAAVAAATTVEDAVRREAKLAQACADCHVDAGVLPEFRDPPRIPADRPTIEARMARHLWATDRLWEGMVGSSDESWHAGLDVLAASPLPWNDISGDRAALARQLQRLADEARHAAAPDQLSDRARAYGEILVICAACHANRTDHPTL